MATKRKRMTGKQVLDLLDESCSENSESNDGSSSESELEDAELASDKESDEFTSEDEATQGSDDNDDTATTTGWQLLTTAANGFQHVPFSFPDAGVQLIDEEVPDTPLGFFQLFFSDDLLQQIVDNTNAYADLRLANRSLQPHSVWKDWSHVSIEELKAYFGVIFNMALNDKPGIFDYFSTQWLDVMPFFCEVFSRRRFLQIHWMLHVSAPDTVAMNRNRARKVENIVKHMKEKCLEYFFPGPDIAIDETTVAFKGRVAFRMYNPQKPTKWGLRVYVLADSDTGYVSVFEPYYGRETTESLVRPDLNFTSRIVIHLCQQLQSKTNAVGYHLYTDRFYTGYQLALELLNMKIHTTGTIQRNRQGLPEEVKKKMKMQLHEVKAFVCDDKVMFLAWQDKRPVYMLTTYYDASTETVERRSKGSGSVQLQKPTTIIQYTAKMGAVDRADHLCTSYNFARKSVKWWRKLFFWMMEVASTNSFILFRLCQQMKNERPLTHLQYRKQLITALVGRVRNRRRRRGRPSTRDDAERLNQQQHFVGQLDKGKSKDCAVCSNRKVPGERKKTVYYCKTCARHPGLHPTTCCEKYHTVVDYKKK